MARPRINPELKKQQIMLTLSPKTVDALKLECEDKPYTFQSYLNQYIEKNLSQIIDFIKE